MTDFDYSPAPESRAVVDIKPTYGLFIDGEFVDPMSDDFLAWIHLGLPCHTVKSRP